MPSDAHRAMAMAGCPLDLVQGFLWVARLLFFFEISKVWTPKSGAMVFLLASLQTNPKQKVPRLEKRRATHMSVSNRSTGWVSERSGSRRAFNL